MNCVATDNHVLAKVLGASETVVMWYRWLVNRPVVKWWVDDWVGVGSMGLNEVIAIHTVDDDIAEFEILIASVSRVVWWRWLVDGPVIERWVPYWIASGDLSISLKEVEVLGLDTNLKVEAEMSVGHIVVTHNRLWVHCDWNTINLESDLFQWFLQISMKLKETNAIHAIKNVVSLHKISISHLILQEVWLDEHWNTLRLGLHKVNTINAIKNVVSLHEISISHLILQKGWLDEHWNTLGVELEGSLILRKLGSSFLFFFFGLYWWCGGWINGTFKDLKSHVSRWSDHTSNGIDCGSSVNNIVIGSDGSNLGSNISWIVIVSWVVVWVAGISVPCESIPNSLRNNLLNSLGFGIGGDGISDIILLMNILLRLLLDHVEEIFSSHLRVVVELLIESSSEGLVDTFLLVLSELDSSDIAAKESGDGQRCGVEFHFINNIIMYFR